MLDLDAHCCRAGPSARSAESYRGGARRVPAAVRARHRLRRTEVGHRAASSPRMLQQERSTSWSSAMSSTAGLPRTAYLRPARPATPRSAPPPWRITRDAAAIDVLHLPVVGGGDGGIFTDRGRPGTLWRPRPRSGRGTGDWARYDDVRSTRPTGCRTASGRGLRGRRGIPASARTPGVVRSEHLAGQVRPGRCSATPPRAPGRS